MRKILASATVALSITVLLPLAAARATVVHMAINGNDANPGSAATPVATLVRAVTLAEQSGEPSEIVLHAGRYIQAGQFGIPKLPAGQEPPRLTIRAAEKEIVIFDGSMPAPAPQPLEGTPGVYVVKGAFYFARLPDVWEPDTRVRYVKAADPASVRKFPGSYTLLDEQTLVFSTSDGQPPQARGVRISREPTAFLIWRGNITVRGIRFENWTGSRWAAAIDLRGKNIVIEDCTMVNCMRAILVNEKADGTIIRRCAGEDAGGGVYINGVNTTVEDCRFSRAKEPFEFEMYPQDNSGIQYYSPAAHGMVRSNLCVGFNSGIFIKGAAGKYTIEHNTIAGSARLAVYNQKWLPGNVCQWNILSGGTLSPFDEMAPGMVFDRNLIWSPEALAMMPWRSVVETHQWAMGRNNRLADPGFADPDHGDYRLLRTGGAATMLNGQAPVGALPLVPEGYVAKTAPALAIKVLAPAQANDPVAHRQFTQDAWNGGKVTPMDDIRLSPKITSFITRERQVRLALNASHPTAAIKRMRLALDGKPAEAQPFQSLAEVLLPEADAAHKLSVEVGIDPDQWSKPVLLEIILSRTAPTLMGAPRVRTSAHGAVIAFTLARPALARVEADSGNGKWQDFPGTPCFARQTCYDLELGGMIAEDWETPSTEAVAVVSGEWVRPDAACAYRIKVRDRAGNEWTSPAFSFTAKGAARVVFVAPEGRDAEERGTQETPWASLQYALDRALPGDTVCLLPGIYAGGANLFHGGLPGAPITIKGDASGKAVIDSLRRAPALINLQKAPWVEVRNLELRWFGQYGINIVQSPNVTVSSCRIWNNTWGGWPTGQGVFFHESPSGVADHNTIYIMEHSLFFHTSPGARVTYNTTTGNMYLGLWLVDSAQGSVVRNNAFCWSGNCNMVVEDVDPSRMATLDCDYNNFAGTIREAAGDSRPTNNLVRRFSYLNASKRLIDACGGNYFTLEAWQKASGQDAHSIYADPLWIDPLKGRYDLEKNSPHLGAGENGTTIGAQGSAL